MAAHTVNLAIEQGATFDEAYLWKAGPTKETAVPVDLTGCTAKAQFRDEKGSPTVLLEITTENGGIVLNTPPGSIRIVIPANESEVFTWSKAVYDLKVYFPGGKKVRRLAGKVSVSPGVTLDV